MNLTGRPVTPKGQRRRRARQTDRPYLDWLKSLPCCVCHAPPPSDPAHVRLGGRGGVGVKPLYSAVPLCRPDHDTQHRKGHSALMSKEEWLGLAEAFLARWKARHPHR